MEWNQNVLMAMLAVVMIIALIALAYAFTLYRSVRREDAGNSTMKELSGYIYEGAMAFLKREYRIIILFIIAVAVILAALGMVPALQGIDGVGVSGAFCFVIGTLCSGAAGFIGMKAATAANARVAQGARSQGMARALHIAFNGGSVLGISVVGFGLLGLAVVFTIFVILFDDVAAAVPVVAGYGLGCSFIALFARVGGGIYTKAADVGADLVGKVEAGIPEDDPRNPAVIADNVGDNVGDIAGMGSDLCESYVGALVSAISLGMSVSVSGESATLEAAAFPFVIAALGIIAAIAAQLFVRSRNWEDPQKALSIATYVATAFVLAGAFIASRLVFGVSGPFLAVLSGLIVGILIGRIAEYYTSDEYRHVKEIAHQSQTGHATNIISGFSIGMQSTMLTVLLLGAGIVLS